MSTFNAELDRPRITPSECMGMTLRDYFAAKALIGMRLDLLNDVLPSQRYGVAVICYEFADAMLKARTE